MADNPHARGVVEVQTPTWTTAEALEILAEQAVIVAHHLLGYAGPQTMAYASARLLLDTLNLEVRSALGDSMIDFCPECGTSGSRAVMESSPVHARCVEAQKVKGTGDG